MCRSSAFCCLLVIAAVLLILPLLSSVTISAHRLPHHAAAPVLLLGDVDAGATAWERGGRSPAVQGRPREGRELAAPARRLGLRTSLEKPPSPKPHRMTGMAMPVPPPPPSST